MRWSAFARAKPAIASSSSMTSTNLRPGPKRAQRNNPRLSLRHDTVLQNRFLTLLMNTLPGIGQERVYYKNVQVNGPNIFYREAGPANGPVILLLHGVPTS